MTISVVGFFCEDIRQEASGQVSIVGILPDNITVPPQPKDTALVLPKLGLYVRLRFGLDDDLGIISLDLVFPDGERRRHSEIPEELITRAKKQAREQGLPTAGLFHQSVFEGFHTSKAGLFYCVACFNGNEIVCAILNTIEATIPTSSQQPSAQSQPSAPGA